MNPHRPPIDASAGRVRRQRCSLAMRAGVVATVVAASVGLAACTPGPAPQPTPTPLFTSEADAFKAAEQVFRDYIDAENALQNGDQKAQPERFLAGEALEQDIQSKRKSTASGTKILGSSDIKKFVGEKAELDSGLIGGSACLDVSKTRVVNRDGVDITPESRDSVVSLDVQLVADAHSLKIVGMSAGSKPCA